MNMKERFLAAVRREDVDKVSCACPLQAGIVDLMERCDSRWPKAFRDPMEMAILSAAAYRIAGIESVRVPFDLCVEAEAIGCEISTGTLDAQPHVKTPFVGNPDDIEKMKVPDPRISKPMANVLEAIKILREKIGDDVPIVAGALAPFTLSGQIIGVESIMKNLLRNSTLVKSVLEVAEEIVIAYTSALVKAGADVICLIDPTATGEMLGPKFHSEFSSPYTQRVVKEIHRSGTPVVLHICGNSKSIWDYMVETGVDMLSLSESIDMAEAKKKVGDKVSLAGNIHPINVLLLGQPSDVEKAVKECIEREVNDICPGCGFASRTPLENMKKIRETRDRISF